MNAGDAGFRHTRRRLRHVGRLLWDKLVPDGL